MRQLRLCTFNIRWGVGRSGEYALHRTADFLATLGADVVALQEVDRRYGPRSRYDDQPALLAERLGVHATYGASVVRPSPDGPDGEYGLALLTRERPDRVRRALLPNAAELEQRSLLAARVGGTTVVCTHLEFADPAVRLAQAKAVAGFAGEADGSVVVAGDLNDVPGSAPHAALTVRLTDALGHFPDLTERPTFEDPAVGRIDHVLVGPGLTVTAARVVDTDVSDHSAVVVDLALG